MRLLLDEMYPPAAAARLRDRGLDAMAVKELPELAGQEDVDVLAAAACDRRVLVTENVADFALIGRTQGHVGIIFCHHRRFPRDARRIERLVLALEALDRAEPYGLGEEPIQWWLKPG